MKDGLKRGVELSAQEVLKYVEADYEEQLEASRVANVKTHEASTQKQAYSEPGKTKAVKKKGSKSKKRLTSIYDLLD